MNRMLDSFLADQSVWKRVSRDSDRHPPVDMFTGKEAVFIRSEVPGATPENIDITVKEDILLISGEIKNDAPEGFRAVSRERNTGKFSRKVRLPYRIESGAVEAKIENGVLSIRLPRAESDKPVSIKVHS